MAHHPGLGRWAFTDPRSNEFPFLGTARRRSVLHDADADILDQDGVGACVGFTCADILNTSKFYKSRRRPQGRRDYFENDSGFGFYSYATLLDEWPGEQWKPDDTGTTVTSGAEAMRKSGYIDRYEWAWDFGGFLAALERQPVMLGTLWTSGMDDPDSKGLIRPTGDLVGGHAFMAFGVNYVTERLRCRNHWTPEWGHEGDFYLTFKDMEWLIGEQGEVVVPIPVT